VNQMLEQLGRLNEPVDGTLGSVSVIGAEVNGLVGDAVRSLQFEDIVTQLAGYAERHLDQINGVIGRAHGGSANCSGPDSMPRKTSFVPSTI